MKKIKHICIISLLFLGIKSFSQTHPTFNTLPVEFSNDSDDPYKCCTYYQDINHIFDKFLGDWIYNQNGHYFKISIYKAVNQNMLWRDRCREDNLYTRYQYIYNGNTVFDTYITNSCYASSINIVDENNIKFNYTEPLNTSQCINIQNSIVTVSFSLNSNNLPILEWTRTNTVINEKIVCEDGTNPTLIQQLVVPNIMLLTKQ